MVMPLSIKHHNAARVFSGAAIVTANMDLLTKSKEGSCDAHSPQTDMSKSTASTPPQCMVLLQYICSNGDMAAAELL